MYKVGSQGKSSYDMLDFLNCDVHTLFSITNQIPLFFKVRLLQHPLLRARNYINTHVMNLRK